jgi:hypothetical protein
MRMLACVSTLWLSLAALAGVASSTPSERTVAEGTCAFSTSGRMLGCLAAAQFCLNLSSWADRRWIYAYEGHGPEPHVGAKRLGTGVWRVVSFGRSERYVQGHVVAANARRTRWNVKNRRGALVATARGGDGPLMGIIILGWGPDSFC